LLGHLERLFIYFPTPAERDLPLPRLRHGEIEETELTTADGERVFVWHLVSHRPRGITILFFHGNGGNVYHRTEHLDGMAAEGLNVLLLEYRGYGKSSGRPSEAGLYRDADAAYRFLIEMVPAGEIVLFGESLGSAVATDLAIREPTAGLILESAFPSVRHLGQLHYPLVPRLLYDHISHRYDTMEKIRRIQVPVLMIHGDRDDIVPISMGEELFQAAPLPRYWYPVEGADHNDLPFVGGAPYYRRLAKFAAEVTGHDEAPALDESRGP
jgi:fermentation-respiration switch protein FrsA (DUF1100 family)